MSNLTASNGRRLSVAMIVRDEQAALPAALESVRGIADEIVIVDTGSSDGTVEIARRFGAKVLEFAWNDDFSAARNHALAAVNGDWVLWLDAGEVVPDEVATPLRQFVDNEADDANAYLVLIVVPPKVSGGADEQIGRVRLMPCRKQLRFSGRVQETLVPSLAAQGMSTVVTPFRLDRTAREHDDDRVQNKVDRDLHLLRLEIRENGQQPRLLNALGEAYSKTKQSPESEKCFRQALATSQRGTSDMLEAYYGLLTTLEGNDQARDDQMAIAVEALEIFPFDAQLLCAVGGYLQARGQMEVAAQSYQIAHQHGQIDPETWHLRDIGDMAAACLNLTLQLLGKDERALDVLNEALVRNPSSEQIRRRLIELHVKHARLDDALDQVDQFNFDPREREALRVSIRGACQAAQTNWVPALSYLQQAYSAGCRDPLCLRWLCMSLLSTGNTQSAAPIVYEWLRIDPQNTEAKKYDEAIRLGPQNVDLSIRQTHPRPAQAPTTASHRELRTSGARGVNDSPELRRLRIDTANNPGDAGVHFQLGRAYQNGGEASQAEALWRDYLSRNPGAPEVVHALCELLLEQRRPQEAAQVAATLDHADPAKAPFIKFVAGVVATMTADWNTAVAKLETSRQGGYTSSLLLDKLAQSLIALKHYPAAEQVLQELIFLEPMSPVGHRRVLQLYEETGRTAEAQTVRQRLSELTRLAESQSQAAVGSEPVGN